MLSVRREEPLTVFLVHTLDLVDVGTFSEVIPAAFVKVRRGCDLWTREMSEGMEVESIDNGGDEPTRNDGHRRSEKEGPKWDVVKGMLDTAKELHVSQPGVSA